MNTPENRHICLELPARQKNEKGAKIILMANSESNQMPLQGISVLIPHFIEGNGFIAGLGRAYSRLGANVVYGRDNLLQQSVDIDWIHLNWPESIYRWAVVGAPEKKAEEMLCALVAYKKKAVKIILTVHNISPHEYSEDPFDLSVYQQVIELSDTHVHMCPESIKLLENRYRVPSSIAKIISECINFDIEESTMSVRDARQSLSLSDESYVFLQFGYIRQYKGTFRLIRAFWSAAVRNKVLLIAGTYQSTSSRWSFLDLVALKLISKFDRRIRVETKWIENNEIQKYMKASDCVVIGNTSGLNSGIAALAMSFGRLVIGPKAGCMPYRLSQGENLIYESLAQLIQAMEHANKMNKDVIMERNISASLNWSWRDMIFKILNSISPTNNEKSNSLL